MQLTGINIFPIKSMGGMSLQEATALPAGLQYDRRWMLLDEDGRFLTQRHLPAMARIKFQWKEKGFEANFSGGGFGAIRIPFELPGTEAAVAKVWDDEVLVRDMPQELGEWFSEVLETKCRLVRIVENAVRHSLKGKPDKVSSFADITPFLIIGEASLQDLNSRIETPLPMSRFRSNFVFAGGQPYEEDDWDVFAVGDLVLKKYKKCGRCKVTTIDQETGVRMGDEPLNTLSKYRKEGRNMNFGVRAFLDGSNRASLVRIGDEVTPYEQKV